MKAPGWGKAIGIIMIVLGSFGIFFQAYRILIPKIMEMQQKMISGISQGIELSENMNQDNPFRANPDKIFNSFQENFLFSETTLNWLPIFSVLGIVLCIFYIVGGAMLLKPKSISFKMGLGALIAMIALNIISFVILIPNDDSFMLYGVLIYSFIGTAIDIALLIIVLMSNKSAYGYADNSTLKESSIIDE